MNLHLNVHVGVLLLKNSRCVSMHNRCFLFLISFYIFISTKTMLTLVYVLCITALNENHLQQDEVHFHINVILNNPDLRPSRRVSGIQSAPLHRTPKQLYSRRGYSTVQETRDPPSKHVTDYRDRYVDSELEYAKPIDLPFTMEATSSFGNYSPRKSSCSEIPIKGKRLKSSEKQKRCMQLDILIHLMLYTH